MRRFCTALAGFILACLCLALPTSAQAATGCDQRVLDATSDQVLDVDAIEASSLKLERAHGADVRVRAFQEAPLGSLDAYRDQQIEQCASWRGMDGQIKANLIVYLFSLDDRKSAIFYGANYTDELNGDVDDIRDTDMGDRFREGDFSAGVVDAQNATVDALEPSKTGTYVLRTFIVIGALAGLAVLSVLLVRLRRRRKAAEDQRIKMQSQAIAARDQASLAVGGLSMESVKRDYQIATNNLNDTDKAVLKTEYDDTMSLYQAAIDAEYARNDRFATLDPDKKLTTQQYVDVVAACSDVSAKAVAASEAIGSLEEHCSELIRQMDQAPEDLAKLESEYAILFRSQAALQEDGYHESEQEQLGEMRVLLDEAKRQIDAKQFGQAIDEVAAAERLSGGIKARLDALKTVRQDLEQRHADLSAQLQAVLLGIQSETLLQHLRLEYHDTCWRDISDRRDQLERSMAVAGQHLNQAQQDFAMVAQRWGAATESLDAADELMVDPESYPALVSTRADELEVLASSLADRLDRIVSDAQSTEAEVQSMKGKQGGNKRRLTQLANDARSVRERLDAAQPELLSIDANATALAQEIDQILDNAKSVHRKAKQAEDEEEERERRRRRERESSSSSYGSGLGTGYVAGSMFGGGSSSGGGGGGFDSGGGSSGGFGGDGGGSSGGW